MKEGEVSDGSFFIQHSTLKGIGRVSFTQTRDL